MTNEQSIESGGPNATPPTILVVDDNPISLKTVRIALEAAGYAVITAESGTTALDSLERQSVDLVIQDLVLPDIHGYELVRRIRALPGMDAVPIIAFCGLAQRDREMCAVAGFTDYLFKPIEPSRLLLVVQAHLASARSADAAGAGRHVLVVDDDPVLLKLAAVRLGLQGFTVTTARDGVEALALARQSPPHAILSDVLMPAMDGFRLCLEIRRDPDLRGVPVVLNSAVFTDEADRRLAERVGANALITRKHDGGDEVVRALTLALEQGAPTHDVATDLSTDEYVRRLVSQLERQLTLNGACAQRLAVREAELAVLNGLTQVAGSATTVGETLEELLRRAVDVTGTTSAAVYLAEPDGDVKIAAQFGYALGTNAALADAFGCHALFRLALETGEVITIPSLRVGDHEAEALLGGAGTSSMVLAPIIARGERLGLLLIATPRSDSEWATFAEALAGQIGQSIILTRSFYQLTAAERRLADVVSASAAVIFVLRPVGGGLDRVWVSDNVLALTGYTAEEAVGDQDWWRRNVHPDDLATARARGEEVQRSGHATGEYRFRHKDGQYRWIRDELRIRGGERTGVEVIGSWVDMTERRQRDEALRQTEKLATMGQLLAGVAHELNNPLSVVIGQAELIARRLKGGGEAAGLERLGKAAARCGRIVKTFLALVRQQSPERASVHIASVVREAAELLAYPLRIDDVAVELDLAEDLPVVCADSHQLHQALVNLMSNAHYAMRESPRPRVLSIAARHDTAAGRIVLTIADTGTGIPTELQDRIFEPFFTTKPVGQGTGLGLALCHSIVENHGGTLTVTSEPGHGATFRIELPVPPPEVHDARLADTETAKSAAPARVLVVDDEPDVAASLAEILALDGHTADTATSGARALEMMTAGGYDLVFSDMRMPEMDGRALHAEAARRFPGLASRFVFVTGDTLRPVGDEPAAPHAILMKPFTVDDVTAVVRARLGEQAAV